MNTQTFDSPIAVAEAAAAQTIQLLTRSIERYGEVTWVLAGGSTPNLAYEVIAEQYLDTVDWSKVTFILGDERIGPLDSPDNNWQDIENLLLRHVPEATFLRPFSDLAVSEAAAAYETSLATLPQTSDGLPRLDVVWLGMGPDGHTLSLFPGHSDFNPTDTHLVTPVEHSPKPPAERISLTLHALHGSQNVIILATGEGKRDALKDALRSTSHLPIAQAAQVCSNTSWLLDEAATP